MYKLKGKLKSKGETVQVSDKFSKRDFVLTDDNSQYPQDILFQLNQDKCTLLNLFEVGQELEVSFNLRGREWTNPQGETKYFNTLEAWRIDKIGSGEYKIDNPTYTPPSKITPESTGFEDDLPF